MDLNGVVDGLRRMLARLIGGSIRLDLKLCGERLPILADAGQMDQVVMNLVLNARDAMPDGGVLTVETVRTPEGAALRISDTGAGMSEETRSRLFEPFFTTKGPGQGTGLGLATVQAIVREAGGRIEVRSAPGNGSTFEIGFPLAAGVPRPGRPELPEEAARGSGTVLVVDDDDFVRRLVLQVLAGHGYAVHDAPDGNAALAWLKERGGKVDLLLSDLVMPGMHGRELAAKVRSLYPAVRILFLSAFSEGDPAASDLGAPLLRKPFTPRQLLAFVLEGRPRA